MRVLVCGGRKYDDYRTVDRILKLYLNHTNPTIIQGGAGGADFLAKVWAKYWDFPMEEFPADWKKHGKHAGVIRNTQMLLEGKPDLVIAFPGGTGTAHMVKIAKKNGVEVIEVKEDSIKEVQD